MDGTVIMLANLKYQKGPINLNRSFVWLEIRKQLIQKLNV